MDDKDEPRRNLPEQPDYKLPLLLRSAEKVAAFSPECERCRSLHAQIAQLSGDSALTPRMTRRNLIGHLRILNATARHLKRNHGLTEKRHYLKRLAIGSLTVGLSLIALTLVLLSLGVTLIALNISVIALIPRVIFSGTVGYFLDRRAKKLGRIY